MEKLRRFSVAKDVVKRLPMSLRQQSRNEIRDAFSFPCVPFYFVVLLIVSDVQSGLVGGRSTLVALVCR